MAFNATDIYVEGGDNKVTHMWNPGVEKYDTSSFYNWEQDNIPLYDLEERTYYLWEKAGWPTSGSPQINGVVFSVSADALGTQAYADNPNIFLSVSSALEALPDVIRFPIRIEVANYGDLGELVLNNVHFTDTGALEIVNRNFSPFNPGSNTTVSSAAVLTKIGTAAGYNNSEAGLRYITDVSSLDTANTLADTSCVGFDNSKVAINATDSRWNNNSIIVAQMVHEKLNGTFYSKAGRLSVGLYPASPRSVTNKFDFVNYGDINDLTIPAYDVSSVTNEITESSPQWRLDYEAQTVTPANGAPGVVGCFYGNWLRKIEVNNCGGPIYLRNFAVDGAGGVVTPVSHSTKHGININNSEVVLEYCTALRCYNSGFNLVNSNVILSRGAFAYRNYGLSSNTGGDKVRDTGIDAAGFRLINSNVTLSSSPEWDASGGACQFTSTRSEHGIYMHNSFITGGDKRLAGTNSMSMTSLMSFGNTQTGVKMSGSNIDLNGAMDVFLQPKGIDANNSEIKIDELYIDKHQDIGVHLKNSQLVYAKNAPNIVEKTLTPANQSANSNTPQAGTKANGIYLWEEDPGMVTFDGNTQHLKLENSQFIHPRLTAGAGLSRTKYKRCRGAAPGQTTYKLSIPGIVAENNSTAYLTYARIQTNTGSSFGSGGNNSQIPTTGAGTRGGSGNANYGSCVAVKDNSTCRFVGGTNKFTWIDGPIDYADQITNAGLLVNNHSTVKLHGPTLISRFGVNVLVDNASTLDISPPKDEFGFTDTIQWDLATITNHTQVDLQSSRACLVADNNSVINMKDCGDFNAQWAKSSADESVAGDATTWYASALVTGANYSTYETSALTYAGSVQFYPNPQLQAPGDIPYGAAAVARDTTDVKTFPLYKGTVANDTSAISRGGVCLRAMKGSRVNVRNVNFPAGWNNTSALYYNYSDTSVDPNGCEQLRIWNIDPTSKLDMSFASVSGLFPPLVGYNGPSAVYVDDTTNAGAMMAPPTTHYTSSLSVLDSFGPSGTAAATFSSPQNFGPFRIYFSPKLYTKYLVYENEANTETSVIYQTIAQGYNMSGACSAVSVPANPMTTSSGPDLYSVYGAGCTSPSGIQGDISISSMTASAEFFTSEMSRAKDWRWYTSAVAFSFATLGNVSCGRTSFGDMRTDGIPGRISDCATTGYAKPYFKHYSESNFIYADTLLPSDYASRVILDESAIAIFANAKNATLGLPGKPRLVTMISSTTSYAGEGAQAEVNQAGKGFLSASEFDLNKIN